jgi:hypothetical protein
MIAGMLDNTSPPDVNICPDKFRIQGMVVKPPMKVVRRNYRGEKGCSGAARDEKDCA